MSLNWSVIASTAVISLGALGAYLYVLVHQRIRRVEAHWRTQHAAMEAELRVMCASARHVGDRLLILEREVRRLGEALNLLEMKRAPVGHYRHAIALAARGASAEELITSCGLARGEAELMHRLHSERI